MLSVKGKRKGRRLVDEASSDAMPDAAGGEGGHGVVKSYAVIHRYRENQIYPWKNRLGKAWQGLIQ